MAPKSERRLRRLARRRSRAVQREALALQPLALAAIRYVNEIYAPDLREPFSIANRRTDLVEVVRGYQATHRIRRAA